MPRRGFQLESVRNPCGIQTPIQIHANTRYDTQEWSVTSPALHESVEANAMPDFRALEALDWTPECEYRDVQGGGCGHAAEGFVVTPCCGSYTLMCVPHYSYIARWTAMKIASGSLIGCSGCHRPIASAADLQWRPL